MRNKRGILLFVLCVLLCLFMSTGIAAGAADTDDSYGGATFDVWVGGIQVNSDNKMDVLGDHKVSYDPWTQTLTFWGDVTLSDKKESALIYSRNMELTIAGRGKITAAPGMSVPMGIRTMGGSLTIDGNFTLQGDMYAVYSQKDITIISGSVQTVGANYGIFANNTLTITNDVFQVEASGGIKAIYARRGLNLGDDVEIADPAGGMNDGSTICDADDSAVSYALLKGSGPEKRDTYRVTFAGGYVCDVVWDMEVPEGFSVADVISITTGPEGWDLIFREVQKSGRYFYANYYTTDEDGKNAYSMSTPVTEDITVYANWDEAIESVLVQVNPVYCGTEVITPWDKTNQTWKWTKQTGTPLTFVIPGYHYDVFNGYEGDGKAFLWVDEDGLNALTDTVLKGGESYRADIALMPDDGYYFRPDAEVRVNGATMVSYDFDELGFLGVISVSVEPIHTFGGWQVEKEPTNTENGSQFHECSVCGIREYASIPRKTNGATVYVDLGEGHESLASRLYGSDHVVEGSRVEFVTTTEPTTVHFINECTWKITEAVFYQGMLDNGEMFTDLLGLKPIEEYESCEAVLAEKAAFGESHLEDGMVFYAHWAKPAEDTVDITLKSLTCTTEVKLTEHDDYYTQSPKPSYTISGNVKTAPYYPEGGPEAYWVDFFWGMDSPKEGRYDDMDFCAAVITVRPKYGQYIPKDRVRFPGGRVLKTEWGIYYGVMNIFVAIDLHTFKDVPGTGEEPDNMYPWQSPDRKCTKCGYYQNGKWNDPVYPEVTVTYDAAGGTGTMEPDVLTMYDPYTFPECGFTAPEGMTFAGWMVDKMEFPAGYEVDGITDSFTAVALWKAPWTSLQSQINAAEDGAVITLEEDVTAGSDNFALEIPAGKSLTLDLNGHTIDRNLSKAASYGNAITVNGRLIITGDGTITGAYNSGSGGAINNNGYLIIENGTFDGNVGKEAGAVYNAAGATLEVRGGTYTGNSATTWGGGAIVNYGYMFMSGGRITGNSVPMNGGGVWTYGSLTLTGGEISGNTADNGGGIYFKGGTFELSGDPVVKDNAPNNVNMLAGTMITVNGALSENASIGVRPESRDVPVQITSGLAGNGGAETFFSDNANLAVLIDENGEAVVADPPEIKVENLAWDGHTVSWEYPGSSEAMACMVSYFYTYYAVGDQDNYTLKEGTVTPEYNDGVWSVDFTPVVEDIQVPNMGIIQYTISYLDLTGGKGGSTHAYDGSVTVHLVMGLTGKAVNADGEIEETGGTIIAEGPGYYFDGETVNLSIEENEGYKLTLLAHKKGSDTSFTLDENDDMFYVITGEFTRVVKATLETGDGSVAQRIAGRHAAGRMDPWAPIVEYEGGTEVTYYVPYGLDTEAFYEGSLLADTSDLLGDARFAGVGPQQLDAYQSSQEIEEDRNSLPDTVTDEMTWYILWAQPVRDAAITVEPLKAGTQVTSSKTADGNTVQDPEPVVTISGEVELAKDTSAAWLDETYNPLNGTAEKDGGIFAVGLTPKFGYYFDGDSEGSIRINGNQPLGVMNFYTVYLVYGEAAAPAEDKAAEPVESGVPAAETETEEAETAEAETAEAVTEEAETEEAETAEAETAEAETEDAETEEAPADIEEESADAGPDASESEETAPGPEAGETETASEEETSEEPASEAPASEPASETPEETEAAPSDTASVFGGGGIAAIIIAAALAVIGIAVYLKKRKGGAA